MIYDIKSKSVFIHVWDWYQINDIIDTLEVLKPKVFICCCNTEAFPSFKFWEEAAGELNSTIVKNNTKGYFLLGSYSLEDYEYNPSTKLPDFEFLFFPLTFLKYTANIIDRNISPFEPKYLYYSLVNRPHPFRAKMVDALVKHNLNENEVGKFTWNRLTSEYWNPYEYEFKYWKQERILADDSFNTDRAHFSPYVVPEKRYFESVWDLVQESSDASVFLTEKTWKPILWKKPFLVYGYKGYHKALKELGFKLYDELIDYSFDEVEDFDVKSNMIAKELDKLRSISLTKQLEILDAKLYYNRDLAVKLIDSELADCSDFLKKHISTNIANYFKWFK